MTWGTISVSGCPVDDVEAALTRAATAYRKASDRPVDDATAHAIATAITAAASLAASGIAGSGAVSVDLSGHANPGHTASEGQTTDFLTIQVFADRP